MANRRATFAKRQREMDLKQKAQSKKVKRDERKGEVRVNKGPEIAWDETLYPTVTADDPEKTDENAEGETLESIESQWSAGPSPAPVPTPTPPQRPQLAVSDDD